MSWPEEEHLRDRRGNRWHFVYSYMERSQRLFFWDHLKQSTGVVVYVGEKMIPYTRVRDLMKKLVASEKLRHHYERDLKFPLTDYYSELGFLAEEAALLEGEKGR